jgi:hypothetical protein
MGASGRKCALTASDKRLSVARPCTYGHRRRRCLTRKRWRGGRATNIAATMGSMLHCGGMLRLLLPASEERGAELKALDAGAGAFVRKKDMDVIMARFAAMLRTARTESQSTASLASPKRILAVDDSATYLNELASALRDEGYDVVLAHSGEEAIEMLAVGADDYIAKSHEFDVLRARIQAQIRRKQFEDENRRIRDQLLSSDLEAAEVHAALFTIPAVRSKRYQE